MTGAEAWILAGGAHHTAFSLDLTAEQMGDWGAMMGIECVFIDKDTTIRNFKNELRWNEIAFRQGVIGINLQKSKNKERGGEPVVVSPPYFYGLCLFFSACMPARSRCSDIVLFPCLPGGSGAGVPVQLR